MNALKLTVRALCIIPFLTGVADVVNGVGLLSFAGARLGSAAADPVLNSQVSFWGAIWLGFGVILWRSSSRLRAEPDLFRILCGTLVLSGLARFGSALVHGWPGPELVIAMAVELVGGAGLALWHASALSQPDLNEVAQS